MQKWKRILRCRLWRPCSDISKFAGFCVLVFYFRALSTNHPRMGDACFDGLIPELVTSQSLPHF